VGALGDVARDFVEVELHHVGVGIGQREGSPDAAGRADGAEQIGVVIALVGGLPWPRSAPGPLPNLAVLLADAGLVFKPDFDRRRLPAGRRDAPITRAREVLWNGPPLLPASYGRRRSKGGVGMDIALLASTLARTCVASSGWMRPVRWLRGVR
jgi:hypothetical protein